MHATAGSPADPLEILGRWLEQAREAGAPAPRAMTVATATGDGQPSARMVTLKQLDSGGLVFTTGLWTRKARELHGNPLAAAVFYWPSLGRQARIEGRAEIAERELAEKLFAERPRSHQLQALVSRQGEEIGGLDELRTRLAVLEAELAGGPVPCPGDWGAVRIVALAAEFWEEADDRLHSRQRYEFTAKGWARSLLAP
jgi:pyridoxamine 5'-phosphate oxidase